MKRAIFWGLTLINAALMAWFVATLPDTVPVHFDAMGQADRMGSRLWYLLFAALPLVLMGGYEVYVRATKRNTAVARNRTVEDVLVPMIALLFAVLGWIMLIVVRTGEAGQLMPLILVAIGLAIMFISNYMNKLSRNRTMGIKLPWTLKDDRVWNKTHRLAGYTGMAGGLVMTVGGLIGLGGQMTGAIVAFIVGLLVAFLPPTLYARALYHRLNPR